MTLLGFSELFIYLALYSVMGWFCEGVYCSVPAGKIMNRGFFRGPYCPVYGIGAVSIIMASSRLPRFPFLVFLVSLSVVTVLEFAVHWLTELLFQIRWWDYSHRKWNLRGRICLLHSLLFGAMGLSVVLFIHPFVKEAVESISSDMQRILASAILAVFFIDSLYSLNSVLRFTERLKALQKFLSDMERYQNDFSWYNKNDLQGSISRLKKICIDHAADQKLTCTLAKLEAITAERTWQFPQVRSFPQLKPLNLEPVFDNLRTLWKERVEAPTESLRRRIWNAAETFRRKTVSATRETAKTFASGLGFYKIFWIFMTASVFGYIVEMFYCLLKKGVLQSRQGLLYGPFSQIYGIGAILIVLLLSPLAKKSSRWLFAGGALIGGVFEYVCSYVQEKVFGSVSWDYSQKAISIHGRTNLTYMLFWGILGFLFMKEIYPRLSGLIERIPNRQGFIISWFLIVGMAVNMFLSASAVYRWSLRLLDVPPVNAYDVFLDRKYPNETMEEIYPNLKMKRFKETGRTGNPSVLPAYASEVNHDV